VCPPPLLVKVQQNPLAAVLLRQVLNFIEHSRRVPDFLEVSLDFLRSSFPSRFLDSVEPRYVFHSAIAPDGLRFAHNPC